MFPLSKITRVFITTATLFVSYGLSFALVSGQEDIGQGMPTTGEDIGQGMPTTGEDIGQGMPTTGQSGGQSTNVALENPLSVSSIRELLVVILNIMVTIAIPIIVLFIIYAGFLFVTARGNEQQLSQAKRALLYALIGGVLVIGAEAITVIISDVVSEFQ